MGNVNAIGHARNPQRKSDVSGGWDEACIQRLLCEGKVAPRGLGAAEGKGVECPICFLFYGAVNYSTCCHQPICTECYLQVRPLRRGPVCCPFCGKDRFQAFACRDELEEAPPAKSSSASASTSPTTKAEPKLAKVADRLRIEDQMRAQLEESRRRGDSAAPLPAPPAPAPAPRRIGGLGMMLRGRRDANLALEDLHALLHSLPTDLHHVEELMVLEAMQASLEDEERRQRTAAAEAAPAPTDPEADR